MLKGYSVVDEEFDDGSYCGYLGLAHTHTRWLCIAEAWGWKTVGLLLRVKFASSLDDLGIHADMVFKQLGYRSSKQARCLHNEEQGVTSVPVAGSKGSGNKIVLGLGSFKLDVFIATNTIPGRHSSELRVRRFLTDLEVPNADPRKSQDPTYQNGTYQHPDVEAVSPLSWPVRLLSSVA